ncbi:hypothetical protein CEE37_03120 [candidate division LCP-89 bacterium B3_LCP]|uniref:Secretion system C-terminal sorting domain-containing protein n=1 Tax=candidate division LCP-89 bacterium B3_LCP TaxID=2012998 RepID=A0A532V2X2_UNCL8|nr:MAG: hypothetical protein CEE37_03120 [candidate division LCP-89 bacterium B3_LCP]
MTKVTIVLMLSFLIAFSALAYNEDESFGYTDPVLSQWGLDNVTWTQQGNATATFRRAASGAVGDYWYCFGDQYVGTAHAFNLTTNTWAASTPPPAGATCNWPGITTDDALYIIGGYNPSYYNTFLRFTPTGGGPTGTWSQLAVYPQTACGIAGGWDGGDIIYGAGGGGSGGSLSNAYAYSISGDMWMPIASMPGPMKYCGGGFAGGKFYVVGGIDNATGVYEYSPGTDTWATVASIPVAVWFSTFSISADGDYVYSIGGGGGYGSWPAVDAVQIYDPVGGVWGMDTPLPVAYGTNASDIIPNDPTTGMDAGGYDGVANHAETYRGDGFEGMPSVPIELTAFNAEVVEGGVYLTWTTASEIDCYEWTVLRNGDAVATLPGYGTTVEPHSYSYMDEVGEGTYTYRLLETDIGGATTYSDLIEVTVGAAEVTEYAVSQNYPNPFNPSTSIAYEIPEYSLVNLSVYNINGELVAELVDGYRSAGRYDVTFSASGFTSGVYFYKLTAGDYSSMHKMTLMK